MSPPTVEEFRTLAPTRLTPMPDEKPFAWNHGDAPSDAADADALTRVQCPNCCRLAFVVRRSMGLLFYSCELCGTVGAMPDTTAGRDENKDQ